MSLFVFKENEFWGRRKDNDLGFSILKNHPEENDSIERKEYGFLGKKGGKDKVRVCFNIYGFIRNFIRNKIMNCTP